MSIKINQIKEIEILSSKFKVTWDKTNDAGSFSWTKSEIVIGIKSIKIDPLYTYSVISHELMELILVSMGGRYQNGREAEGYLFSFNHQTFENAIQIHSQSMAKFIK